MAALEAALAVRDLAGDAVHIELIAPENAFVYRALSVGAPFGHGAAPEVPLARLRRTHGVVHRRDIVTAVHPRLHEVELGDGSRQHYDHLVVALGARQEAWLQGSVSFTGPHSVDRVRAVLDRVRAGEVGSLAFAAPAEEWTLPMYELALLTASWAAEEHIAGLELTVVTPEREPLSLFGPQATQAIRHLLADRGIRLRTGFQPGAGTIAADAVITLPRLRRSPFPGLPATRDGFVPTDEHARVAGLHGVYAAGDMTDQRVKQGGLAAQQADAAAADIASALGRPVAPEPYDPTLRGLLLTGVASAFLRRDPDGTSIAAFDALWWPPAKLAGRYLGPYLTEAAQTLVDRPAPADPEQAARDRHEVRAIAVSLAEADARWGDPASALKWLQAVERLDGTLDPDLARLREKCTKVLTG